MTYRTSEQRTQIVAAIVAMIQDDVAAGTVPANVPDWTSLHDHVDANEYALNAMPDWESTDECYAFTNDVEAEAFCIFDAARGPIDEVTVNMYATAVANELREHVGAGHLGNVATEQQLRDYADEEMLTVGAGLEYGTDEYTRLNDRIIAEAARLVVGRVA